MVLDVSPFESGVSHLSVDKNGAYYNEKFAFDGAKTIAVETDKAFEEGLPFPMLKILEYFSFYHGGFDWGMKYRQAGHYTSALIWTGFACWIWQCILLGLLPHHYSKAGILSGCFLIAGIVVYACISPAGLNIPFMGKEQETVFLRLSYGTSFYLAMAAGNVIILFL